MCFSPVTCPHAEDADDEDAVDEADDDAVTVGKFPGTIDGRSCDLYVTFFGQVAVDPWPEFDEKPKKVFVPPIRLVKNKPGVWEAQWADSYLKPKHV